MIKKLSVVLLAILLFAGTSFAFAWWDSLETDETVNIDVGEGVTLSSDSVDFDENLRPQGVITQEGQTDELSDMFVLDVSSEGEIEDDINLEVSIENLSTGSVDFSDYIEFEFDNEKTLTGGAIDEAPAYTATDVFGENGFFGGQPEDYEGELELSVRLIEDFTDYTDEEDRDEIFNSPIDFDITFELVTKDEVEGEKVSSQQELDDALDDDSVDTIILDGTFDGFEVERGVNIKGGTVKTDVDSGNATVGLSIDTDDEVMIDDVTFEGEVTGDKATTRGVETVSGKAPSVTVTNSTFNNEGNGIYFNQIASGEISDNVFNENIDDLGIGFGKDINENDVTIENNDFLNDNPDFQEIEFSE